MTNEKIGDIYAKPQKNYISFNEALNLARQDEREKMTEEKVKGYLGGLGGKESALIVLNYLLRGGITDDDLRGLRLQWIKDEREKMQGVDCWVSWDMEQIRPIWITSSEPTEAESGRYNINNSDTFSQINMHFATHFLKMEKGQCKKFRIVEVTS